MKKCGYDIARSSIRKVLDTQGLPPGSNSSPGSSWTAFWRNHALDTIGIDFVQTAVGLFGKVSYRFVLVAIEHDTRKTHLLGITEHPSDFWLRNTIAAATMDGEPLAKKRHWVHDNDGKFQTLPDILEKRGLKSVNISSYAPDMNAFIERFFRSLKGECLDHMVMLTDSMLRNAVTEYLDHYNTERPHQGLIMCRSVIGLPSLPRKARSFATRALMVC